MAGDELFDQIIEREQYPENEAALLICQVCTEKLLLTQGLKRH